MASSIEIRGDVIGAAVGAGATVRARTIYVDQSSGLADDLKRVLKDARDRLEGLDLSEADKKDATEDLGKLAAELEKSEKNPGLVQRYWNRIKEVAPPVASILSAAASIAKLLGGGG
jgi:hypothetical protein